MKKQIFILVSLMLGFSGCNSPKDSENLSPAPQGAEQSKVGIEIASDKSTTVLVGDSLDLNPYIVRATPPLNFKVISGEADIFSSQLYAKSPGPIKLKVTDKNGASAEISFTAIGKLNITSVNGLDNEVSGWGYSLNPASRFQIVAEGGVPPYKYSIGPSSAVLKTKIDEKGGILTSNSDEDFIVTVEDSRGVKVQSSAYSVKKSRSDWIYDQTWATSGIIPSRTGSGVRKMKLDLTKSYFFSLSTEYTQIEKTNFGIKTTKNSVGLGLTKYTVLDGQVEKNFGDNGTYTLFQESGKLYALDLALQTNGKILVLGKFYPDRYGYDSYKEPDKEDLPTFFLVRLNADGKIDPSFGKKDLSLLLGEPKFGYSFENPKLYLDKADRILIPVDSKPNKYVVALDSEGSIDKSFGAGGKAIVPKGLDINAMSIAIEEILVTGSYYGESDPLTSLPGKLGIVSFNLKGKLNKKFKSKEMMSLDLEHKPRGVSGVTEPHDILVDSKGNIFISGETWDTPFFVKLSANGEVKEIQTLNNEIGSRPFSTILLTPYLKNSFLMVSDDPYAKESPIWEVKESEFNMGYFEIKRIDPLASRKFKAQELYSREMFWWDNNSAHILVLPDGSVIMTVSGGGLVRVLH